jgi:hypothetical protein
MVEAFTLGLESVSERWRVHVRMGGRRVNGRVVSKGWVDEKNRTAVIPVTLPHFSTTNRIDLLRLPILGVYREITESVIKSREEDNVVVWVG